MRFLFCLLLEKKQIFHTMLSFFTVTHILLGKSDQIAGLSFGFLLIIAEL